MNSGWILAFSWLEQPSESVLSLGGISNSRNMGMLAVLDAQRITGHSPAEAGSEFECKNCPPGYPLRYFLFPRSALNLATASSYNAAVQVTMLNGRFAVHTMEVDARIAETTAYIDAIYQFSPDLQLMRASFGDGYWDLHRRLEMSGTIKHPRAECPDRDGPKLVRSWDPQNGWRDLQPAEPPGRGVPSRPPRFPPAQTINGSWLHERLESSLQPSLLD